MAGGQKKQDTGGPVFVCQPVGFNKTSRDFPDFLARCGRLVGKIPQVLHTFAARVPCVCCFLKAESCPLKNEKKTHPAFARYLPHFNKPIKT